MEERHASSKSGLQRQQYHGVTWLDVENPNAEVLSLLERKYGLDPVFLGESVQKVQHTQIEHQDKYLFFILHYPVVHPQTGKLSLGQIGIFLGAEYLITIRTAKCDAAADLLNYCHTNPDEAATYFEKGAGYVLHTLISAVLEDIAIMSDEVATELDAIEDLVFDNNASDAQRIGKVRQRIVRLMRVIGPKRIVLQDLAEQIDAFSGQELSKYYSNNLKTVNKLWESIGEAKETVEIYKDADFTTSTEQTNQILAVLTIIFTLTIPITVLGTLYGMNIPLPGGLSSGPWNFWGEYTTFVFVLGVSVVLALGMYVYFKKRHWF